MIRRHKARHRPEDIKLIAEAFGSRATQERVMQECLRRFIVGDGADPVLSTSPFDVMFARRLFDESFYAAGIWFQRLFRYRAGRCRIKGILDDGKYCSYTLPEDPRRDAEYRALVSDRRSTTSNLDCLASIIVFHEIPGWLVGIIVGRVPSSTDITDRNKFIDAITTIRDIWIELGKETTESLRERAASNMLLTGFTVPKLPRRHRRVFDP